MDQSALAERPRGAAGPVERDSTGADGTAEEQTRGRVLAGAIALGIALRLWYFLSGRSLWIDEARLALNVASRGYAGLLRPLDYDQSAPPLFLWGEKLATQLFGVNEHALWLLPLLSGIVAIGLFVALARRVLPGWPGVLAVASVCVAPTLVHYSATAKPYMGDLTLALAIMVSAWHWVERPGSRLALALPWLGAIGLWASTSAVFSLGAAGCAIVLASGQERRRKAIAIAGLWGASFLVAYALVYRQTAHSEYLHRFWLDRFLTPTVAYPGGPGFIDRLGWVRREVLGAFSVGLAYPATTLLKAPWWFGRGERWGTYVLAAVIATGIVVFIRTRASWQSMLLLGPVALLGAATLVGQYPVSSRLVLFLMPPFYVSFAAGASWLLGRFAPRRRRLAARLVVGSLVGLQFLMAVRYAIRAPTIENVRDMVSALDRLGRREQPVYVNAGALPAWIFYTIDWGHPDRTRLSRYATLGGSEGEAFENEPTRGRVAPGEGWDLRFVEQGRTVLLGVPSGIWRRDLHTGSVDVGWVDNEAGRIVREGRCPGVAWVLLAHTGEEPERLLLEGLGAAGGRPTYQMSGRSASLTRFEFGAGKSECGAAR